MFRKLLYLGIFLLLTYFTIKLVFYRYPVRYMDIIAQNATAYGIEPSLVCAMIHTESKYRENAVSPKGASGLMQVTNATANWIADEMKMENYSYDDIFEPEINIGIGCYYLNWLMERYTQQDTALAAYNAGNGNVDKWLRDTAYSIDGKQLLNIPFEETRTYVERVRINKVIYDCIIPLHKYIGRFL